MKIKLFILILGFLLCSVSFPEGGWSGNGAGNSLDFYNIWFLGNKPIPYCIISQNSFPTKSAINQMVHQNAKRWNSFFSRYNIDNEFVGDKDSKLPDGSFKKMSLIFEPSNDCNQVERDCGPESSDMNECGKILNDKILFLVGVRNKVVDHFIKMNGNIQGGAAIRTTYNHQTHRSGGIVWVPQIYPESWSNYTHVLLHEMGHVFGMKHDSCWVMSSNILSIMRNWIGLGYLEQIESPNWPYSFRKNDRIVFTDSTFYRGEPLGYYSVNDFLPLDIQNFLKLSSKNYFKVSGLVTDVLENKIQIRIEVDEYPTKKQFVFEGALSAQNLEVSAPPTPQLYTEWNNQDNSIQSYGTKYLRTGWVSNQLQGVLTSGTDRIPVILNRNQGMSLSVYFPGTSSWLVLQTVHFNNL